MSGKGSSRRPPSRPDLLPCETAGHAMPDKWGNCWRCGEQIGDWPPPEQRVLDLLDEVLSKGEVEQQRMSGREIAFMHVPKPPPGPLYTSRAALRKLFPHADEATFDAVVQDFANDGRLLPDPGAVPHQGDTER